MLLALEQAAGELGRVGAAAARELATHIADWVPLAGASEGARADLGVDDGPGTAATVGEETYFRDRESASFVDEVLDQPTAALGRARLWLAAAAIALTTTGVVIATRAVQSAHRRATAADSAAAPAAPGRTTHTAPETQSGLGPTGPARTEAETDKRPGGSQPARTEAETDKRPGGSQPARTEAETDKRPGGSQPARTEAETDKRPGGSQPARTEAETDKRPGGSQPARTEAETGTRPGGTQPAPLPAPVAPALASSTPHRGAPGPHKPAALGTLLVHCTPWCIPSVDNQVRGADGRNHRLLLPTGLHRVTVRRLDDHLERSVEIRAGESQTIDFTFE